jgi:tetratricopeptide (TPR) repeat protein
LAPASHSTRDTAERAALIHREVFQLVALILAAVGAFLITRAVAATNREMTLRDAAEWYRRGQQAIDAGRVDEAIDSLSRATIRDRNDKRYLLALAHALTLKRDDEAARAVLLALARLAATRQDVTEALRFYHNALYAPLPAVQADERRRVRLELVQVLLTRDQPSRALSELLALSSDLPDDAATRLEVGQLFARAGDQTHALEQFQRALRRTPDDQPAVAAAGQAAFQLGNYALARTYLRRIPPGTGDIDRTRDVVNLVLSRDPLATRIRSAERRQRLVANFAFAQQRLDTCFESRKPGDDVAALQNEAKAFRGRLAKSAVLEQDMVEAGVDLIERLEQEIARHCAPPTALDQALALIGRAHGADVK